MREEAKNTIRYIGRWAIRIFLIALISTSIKSCANAMTKSEAFEICKDNCGYSELFNSPSNDYSSSRISYTSFLDYLENRSEQYYLVRMTNANYNSNYFEIAYYDNVTNVTNDNFTFITNTSKINTRKEYKTNWKWYDLNGSSTIAYPNGNILPYPTENNTFYMLYGDGEILASSFVPPPTWTSLEYVNSFDGKYYQNFLYYTYQGEVYQQNKLKIGEIIQNDAYYAEVRLRRGKEENNVIIGTSFISFGNSVYNDGVLYYDNGDLYLNTININYGQPYRLEIQGYYGDGGDDLSEDIDWYLFLPVSATTSGDSILSLGSGDFNIQDNASQIIQNQEESNNWWKQTINDMFVVSGEEIQQIIDNTMQELKIESGEIQEATRVLNYLDAEPGDFIISWGNLTTHFSISGEQLEKQLVIPARQINFSEMERNSEELHEAMNWARIITNISIFSILMHQMYICFIATLGVPVNLYGQKQDEKAELAKQEEAKKQSQAKQEANWISRLEAQRYNEWLKNHRKR